METMSTKFLLKDLILTIIITNLTLWMKKKPKRELNSIFKNSKAL